MLKEAIVSKQHKVSTIFLSVFFTRVGCSHILCEQQQLEFHIVDTTQDPILASQDLGIVKIVLNINRRTPQLIKLHPKLFQGLRCLKNPYNIEIHPSVAPVVCPPQNQLVTLRERLKQTSSEMENIGVIRKVDEPTDWVPKSRKSIGYHHKIHS